MIRVLLVNSINLISNIMAAVMEEEADMQVVGQATSVTEALSLAANADIVLTSSQLPNGGALRLTQAIAENHVSARVLILGLAESKEEVIQYVQAGAAGYVPQDDSVHDLLHRIRVAYEEEALISPQIAAALMSRIAELSQLATEIKAEVGGTEELTPREREILELIGQGLTNQQIADRLVIEVGTVKNHVHSILQKLDASSRHDAAAYLAIMD
jgi:DNA-binding NarL/FixJ family response regulator